jgi:hypothetical protein
VAAVAAVPSRPIEIPVAGLDEFGLGIFRAADQALHRFENRGGVGVKGECPKQKRRKKTPAEAMEREWKRMVHGRGAGGLIGHHD